MTTPTPDLEEDEYLAPDGRVDALWMKPHRELVAKYLTNPATAALMNAALDACYEHGQEDAGAERDAMNGLLGAILRGEDIPTVARLTAENQTLREDKRALADARTWAEAELDAERARVQAVRDLCGDIRADGLRRVWASDVLAAIGDGDDRG